MVVVLDQDGLTQLNPLLVLVDVEVVLVETLVTRLLVHQTKLMLKMPQLMHMGMLVV